MSKIGKSLFDIIKIAVGCALFGLGFNLFLAPNDLNAGGLSGLAMILVRLMGRGSVGTITAIMNLPLFALAGVKIGKKFFFGSLIGMALSALALDLFAMMPIPATEPLIGGLYGGLTCGVGLGIVFMTGVSTGGSDIVVRLLKLRYRNVPIGMIAIMIDASVAVLTGIVFRDITLVLYSGVAIFVCGKVLDAVVYSFDYSKVALIISAEHEKVARAIWEKLDRGVTYLHGEGAYSQAETKVILTAVKRQQLADLKQLVVDIDPNAFVILQEAHQVLGDGFSRYSKDSL
ncbi:MAG: YitT family protein [Oscillospiraceae bacterium]|nr:YitT family protein [Oscillospiraceae bacterium]